MCALVPPRARFWASRSAIEVGGPSHAEREAENRARGGTDAHIDRLSRVRHCVGRNTDLTADRLQVAEGQPFIGRNLARRIRLHFCGHAKDRGDFLVAIAALGHDLRSLRLVSLCQGALASRTARSHASNARSPL